MPRIQKKKKKKKSLSGFSLICLTNKFGSQICCQNVSFDPNDGQLDSFRRKYLKLRGEKILSVLSNTKKKNSKRD